MIKFKSVKWKNLLSTGNQFTEVFLGNRKATLILGENGSGKSTMLDVLCFGLFGKGFRKIPKNSLINSVNQRGMFFRGFRSLAERVQSSSHVVASLKRP